MSGRAQRHREWCWGQWTKDQISLCQSLSDRKRYGHWNVPAIRANYVTVFWGWDCRAINAVFRIFLQEDLSFSHHCRKHERKQLIVPMCFLSRAFLSLSSENRSADKIIAFTKLNFIDCRRSTDIVGAP